MKQPDDLQDLVPIADVPRLLPRERGKRRVHTASVRRWCTRGVAGVKLQSVLVGRTRCTHQAWLAAFFAEVAAARAPKTAPPAQEQTRGARSDRLLRRHGLA